MHIHKKSQSLQEIVLLLYNFQRINFLAEKLTDACCWVRLETSTNTKGSKSEKQL